MSHSTDDGLVNTKPTSESALNKRRGSDFLNSRPIQLVVGLTLTCATLLFYSPVSTVFNLSTQVQMGRVHTKFVILGGAVMQHKTTLGNWAIIQNPRSDVRPNCSFRLSSANNAAVTRAVNTRRPEPACFSFTNLFPKALREGWRKALRGQILGSNLDHRQLLPRWVYRTREALSF